MFKIASRKMLGTPIVAGVMAIGLAASSGVAQAKPGHGGHGGHGGGWSHGHGGHGGHWGHRGHRGWGWGPRTFVSYGCYSRPRFDIYGNYIGRVRVCR
jgi:hypothetical protein